MLRRGVLRPIALAHVREACRARMAMHHVDWETQPIRACVGLRQICSAAPMMFRWVVHDCTNKLQETWRQRGGGLKLQSRVLPHVVLADDTWPMDATPAGLDTLSPELWDAARSDAGLAIKREKCSYANCSHTPHPAPAPCALPSTTPGAPDGTRVGRDLAGWKRIPWRAGHCLPKVLVSIPLETTVLEGARACHCQTPYAPSCPSTPS